MSEEHAVGFLLIVIENVGADFVAYSPDLPGCVATGATREEAEKNMDEAIRGYVEGRREDGLSVGAATRQPPEEPARLRPSRDTTP